MTGVIVWWFSRLAGEREQGQSAAWQATELLQFGEWMENGQLTAYVN
jgi:hypothetical protein